jgi:nucleoid-associated protein YgaU
MLDVSMRKSLTTLAMVVAALAGCATPTPPPQPAPTAPAPAPQEARPAPPPEPAPPPAPELSPAAAKAQAQKLAIEAVDQLQNGDETAARGTLERALALDAANDLARKLNDQIKADAQKELGSTFFRYTVQRDDSLSKLAQQYLGDRFKFYILAKYNDMPNPSRLAAGQVIRIPGHAPAPAVARPAEPVEAPAPRPSVAEVQSPTRDDAADALRKGRDLEAAGNMEGAYTVYSEAALRYPNNAEVKTRLSNVRATLVRTYDREGTQAFQRQNLELAITKWDRILEIDPSNKKAKLERERAADLQKRMSEKFGTKQ